MHMSSMDTSSITAQHSTVEESRFRAILGFSKLLIIQTPGGGVRLAANPISSDRDDRRFENIGCRIFLVRKIWQVFFGGGLN